jgi:outer membrane protein
MLSLLVLLLAGAVRAEDVKLGVVDRERALFSTEQGKKVRDELQAKTRAAQGQLDPMVAEFKKLREEVESKRYVLSQEALLAKQAQLAELQNKIEAKNKELEGQLKIDQVRLLQPLEEKMKTTIDAIGKEQGFYLIFERNSPYVVYAREAIDITDLVVSRFNAKQ